MQNKANFPEAQMNVSANMTKDCENKFNPTLGKNKPNSNPNKPNWEKPRHERNHLF